VASVSRRGTDESDSEPVLPLTPLSLILGGLIVEVSEKGTLSERKSAALIAACMSDGVTVNASLLSERVLHSSALPPSS